MRTRWLVMDIGCIECGATSEVVGLFKSAMEAETMADVLNKHYSFHDHCQHNYKVFDLKNINGLQEPYTTMIKDKEERHA